MNKSNKLDELLLNAVNGGYLSKDAADNYLTVLSDATREFKKKYDIGPQDLINLCKVVNSMVNNENKEYSIEDLITAIQNSNNGIYAEFGKNYIEQK